MIVIKQNQRRIRKNILGGGINTFLPSIVNFLDKVSNTANDVNKISSTSKGILNDIINGTYKPNNYAVGKGFRRI